MTPSATSLRTTKRPTAILARGRVLPKHAGKKVIVKFAKKRNGHFVRVATKRARLNARSRYRTSFRRPQNTNRCRVVTVFRGDDAHESSTARRTFAC